MEISKKVTVLWLINNFSKTLLITEKRLTGQELLAEDLSPASLNTGTTDETFQQSGKQELS